MSAKLLSHLFRVVVLSAFCSVAIGESELVVFSGGQAGAVSADGAFVFGWTGTRPLKWSRENGHETLPTQLKRIRGSSGDVSVLLGAGGVWRDSSLHTLPALIGDSAIGLDISSDGTVVVGGSDGTPTVWRSSDSDWSPSPLTIPNGLVWARAWAISDDGKVLAGHGGSDPNFASTPLAWRDPNPPQLLELLSEGDRHLVTAASSDGSVLGGIAGVDAVIWREDGQLELLGHVGSASQIRDLSADGTVAVGGPDCCGNGELAFVWDGFHGLRELRTVLLDSFGVDLDADRRLQNASWESAHGISDDKMTIVGRTQQEDLSWDGWAVLLDRPIDSIMGDANLDYEVNFADFLLLSINFGQPGEWGDGDFDLSGTVDFDDFLRLSSNFGTTRTSSPVAVPEPHSWSIAIAACWLSFAGIRRRKSKTH